MTSDRFFELFFKYAGLPFLAVCLLLVVVGLGSVLIVPALDGAWTVSVFAGVLYVFTGLAAWGMWRDLR